MKESELKQIIKEVLLEDIQDYISYDNNVPDLKVIAGKITSLTEKYVKQVEKALHSAGPWMAPSMKRDGFLYLKKLWGTMKLPNTPIYRGGQ